MFTDKRGLCITSISDEAVNHYDRTIERYLHFGKDTGAHLKATLHADPDFALAHCTKGYFFLMFAKQALISRAEKSLQAAKSSAKHTPLSAREELHIAALEQWLVGNIDGAILRWERILEQWPLDMLALKLANFFYFYLGQSEKLAHWPRDLQDAWQPEVPGYGFVRGMNAFGFEEYGDYDAAETAGREAVAINSSDLWAVHAVAHVMEMQDRQHEGIEWLNINQSSWAQANNFVYHLWWHLALFHLELEQYDEVLNLYDQKMRAEPTDEYLDVCNATSMLWRLEERGIDIGHRWEELADIAVERTHDHLLVFPDIHYHLAIAATGRTAETHKNLDSMTSAAAVDGVTQASVYADIGLALCRGIDAWYAKDFERTVAELQPLHHRIIEIGGSHAQRDVFHQMLIAAALQIDDPTIFALLRERLDNKPRNPWGWRRYTQALEKSGDLAGAAKAAGTADGLLAKT